jgi:uncharacterized protein Veg
LVAFLAGFALDRVKEKIQADVGDALQIMGNWGRTTANA